MKFRNSMCVALLAAVSFPALAQAETCLIWKR